MSTDVGFFKKIFEKTVDIKKETDGKDVTFPETKGEISEEAIKQAFQDVDDLDIKKVKTKTNTVTIIYLNTLVTVDTIQRHVLNGLERMDEETRTVGPPEEYLKNAAKVKNNELPTLLHDIASGYIAVLFPNNEYYKIEGYSAEERSIESTENESTVLGPQDSFTESIKTNLSLLKRRIRSVHLKTNIVTLGTEVNDSVAILYMENIANKENVDRVKYRINNIEYQGFAGMPVLKQMLEDKPLSPFPQFGISSRPDNVMAALLDGRIAVIKNGDPGVAILPTTFFEMFGSPEDFYNRWTTATLLRTIRLFGFFVSILFTATYVAVLTYHPDMIPPQMLRILTESRSRVPFPPMIEALLIELVIEILREAGSRMPTKIGQTIGIVGGIVIGTAAVEAGLASNVLIVVVASSALLSFITPNFLMSNAIRFVRYFYIFAAGVFGMFGQALLLAWMFGHLLNMTSLGSPYLTPVIPREWTDLLNSIFRAPINFLVTRTGMSRAKRQLTRPLDEE